MPVSVVHWCVGIGIFNFRFFAELNKLKFQLNPNGMKVSCFFSFCVLIVLIICDDTELNPGPKKDKIYDNFWLCHWNLNGIAAPDFCKLSLFEAYNAHHMYEIIHLSETYLDSSVPFDDSRLNLSGCKWDYLLLEVFISNKKRFIVNHIRSFMIFCFC